MFAVLFLYICFTATMFLGSLIVTHNHYPVFVAGARFFASGVILLSLYAGKEKYEIIKQLPSLCHTIFFKYALCLYSISAIGFSWSLQYVDPVKGCFIFVLSPFVTALLLYCFHDEKLSTQKMIGLSLGFLGVIPIVLESEQGCSQTFPWYMMCAGYCVFVSSVVLFAYGWILNQQLHKKIHLPSSLVTGAALCFGGGVTLALFFAFSPNTVFSMRVTHDFWWLLLLFSLLTAIAYNLYASLLKRFSATFIAFASFLEPAFGLLYASVFLGQPISMLACICLGLLGFGLYLFYQEELRLQ